VDRETRLGGGERGREYRPRDKEIIVNWNVQGQSGVAMNFSGIFVEMIPFHPELPSVFMIAKYWDWWSYRTREISNNKESSEPKRAHRGV